MGDIDLEKFFDEPSIEALEPLRKAEWVKLAKHCEVPYKIFWKKAKIQNAVVEYLIEAEILGDGAESLLSEEPDAGKVEHERSLKIRQMELDAEIEREKLRLEAEGEKLRLEAEGERLRLEEEREREKMKLEIDLKREVEMEKSKVEERLGKRVPGDFKLDHAVKSVPVFVESEVDSFFLQFEKIATQREWPSDKWSTIIQGAYRGKARDVYAALSLSDSADYDIVKKEILKAYEWVPEKYRERFRQWRKKVRLIWNLLENKSCGLIDG